ncbi:purine-cytosine permease family protein [Oenococcus oeni]|uniref:purine-cytosine permease family protein n=1 Tax=Oenococcus oeni TaxID=1247 RepID=UPI0008F907B3|nr:cytosine permease [Oenococcus oeni]MDI4583577.1 allantoin permease [Oenococcus sp. UCMA 14587]OIK56434.1 allantoin permease [Oenococcus oeni]OIM25382.1 allantoin permease [Oenococcus oeni]OIM62848.1 allantoin permease [Oenococcus oeni]SYW14243.1 Allantoin permease [Oenococcus oeni]
MNEDSIRIQNSEKTLTPGKLFYNWFAANIGILGFVYGAIIVSYHLSFIQSTIAALIGALSFTAPGWVAMIGRKEGITTFKLSRAAYGTRGNKIPNFIAWINMIGWVSVNVLTGTLLLTAMLKTINIPKTTLSDAIALAIFGGLVIASGLLKENVLAKIQTWLSWIFGILTLVILFIFLFKANWNEAFQLPSGSWVKGFLPAISIVAAGSGISWSMAAADWGAYVKTNTKPSATFWNTTLGGSIPLFILMSGGVLLSTISPNLANASEPFSVMYNVLPSWFGFTYFLVAVGGLIPQCIISLRSARINLSTVGINISQRSSLVIHGAIVILIPIYVLFVSGNFLSSFELFLNFLGICLASWVAIFLCDNVMYRKKGYDIKLMENRSPIHYKWDGIISWILATLIGLLFTNNAIWNGPFAKGIFRNNSLGVFISGITAILFMFIFYLLKKMNKRD